MPSLFLLKKVGELLIVAHETDEAWPGFAQDNVHSNRHLSETQTTRSKTTTLTTRCNPPIGEALSRLKDALQARTIFNTLWL